MSFKTTLRKLCFGGMLGLASLMGAAMRPEEIEALMRDMNVPKIVHTLEDENNEGDDPIPPTSSGAVRGTRTMPSQATSAACANCSVLLLFAIPMAAPSLFAAPICSGTPSPWNCCWPEFPSTRFRPSSGIAASR